MNKKLQLIIISLIVILACETNVEEKLNTLDDCSQLEDYYTNNIRQIMESNCTTCHTGSGPSGGLSLNTYTTVYNAIKSGNVLDRIQREQDDPGFMPPNGEKLSDDHISLIQTFFEMKCQ